MNDLKKEIGTLNYQAHALAAALDMLDASLQSVSEASQSVGITERSLPKVSRDPTTWPVWTVVFAVMPENGDYEYRIECVRAQYARLAAQMLYQDKHAFQIIAVFKGEQVNQI